MFSDPMLYDTIQEKIILNIFLGSSISVLCDTLESMIKNDIFFEKYHKFFMPEIGTINDLRQRLSEYITDIRNGNYRREIWDLSSTHFRLPLLVLIDNNGLIKYKVKLFISDESLKINFTLSYELYKIDNTKEIEKFSKNNLYIHSIIPINTKDKRHFYSKRISYKELNTKYLDIKYIKIENGLIYYDEPNDHFIIDRFSLLSNPSYDGLFLRSKTKKINDIEYQYTHCVDDRLDESLINEAKVIPEYNMIIFKFRELVTSNSRRSESEYTSFGCIILGKVEVFISSSRYGYIEWFK